MQLITGISSGIGKAIAQRLLKKKMAVLGISRRVPSISHSLFHHLSFDLAKTEETPLLCKKILHDFPDLNTVICNAGVGHFGHLEQLSNAEIQQIISVNLTSHILLIKGLISHLKRKKSAQILFIGSEAALQGKRKGSIYCASKFALRGFAQALREECSASNLRVSIIQPGMVSTPFYDNLNFSPGEEPEHSLDPEDIAATAEMILDLPAHAVCDEILISPLKKVLQFK